MFKIDYDVLPVGNLTKHAILAMFDKSNNSSYYYNISEPPKSSIWELVQISYQLMVAAIGLPINFYVTYLLSGVIKRRRRASRLVYLGLHLNISDLLILIIYCIGYSVWLLTMAWTGPAVLCPVYKFLEIFCFYASSNIKVSIAIDLFVGVYFPISSRSKQSQRIYVLLALSWIIAALCSTPQFFLWTVIVPYPDHYPDWAQCSFRYQYIDAALVIYSIFHMLVIFWIPLMLIAPIYILVILKAFRSIVGNSFMMTNKQKKKCHDKHLYAKYCQQTHYRTRLSVDSSSSSGFRSSSIRRKKQKVLRTSMLIIFIYIICWLPYQILGFWSMINPTTYQQHSIYFEWLIVILMSTTIINPFLYGFQYHTFSVQSSSAERHILSNRVDQKHN